MPSFVEDLFSLAGRRAVVIGATGVLGGRIALTLARAGAHVVVAGRSAERGAACVSQIQNEGGKAIYLPADVTCRRDIVDLHDSAREMIGPCDILVNSAGVNSGQPYFEIADDTWNAILHTNVTSVHWACQVFASGMIERGRGSIINVGSASSDKPLSRVFGYSASKAAVVNYTKNLARELGSTGVRVNALSPGFFPAEQNRKILDEKRQEAVLSHTPMGRFGDPSDLDGAVLLLASDEAGRFVTGINLFVDGGFTAMSI